MPLLTAAATGIGIGSAFVSAFQFVRRNIYTVNSISRLVRESYSWWNQLKPRSKYQRDKFLWEGLKEMAYRRRHKRGGRKTYRKRRTNRARSKRPRIGGTARRINGGRLTRGGVRSSNIFKQTFTNIKNYTNKEVNAGFVLGWILASDAKNIDPTIFQKFFHQYRIKAVTINCHGVVATQQVAGQVAPAGKYGGQALIAYTTDFDPIKPAETFDEMQRKNNSMIITYKADMTLKLKIMPKAYAPLAKVTGDGLTARAINSPWIDINAMDIMHHGLRMASFGIEANDFLQITERLDVEFRMRKQ